jgi:hypothetical protein
MHLHPIRIGHRFQGVPFVPGLSAAFLATLLSQALGLLFQPIARWRLAAVPTVLGDLIFQPLQTLCHLAKRLVEKLDHSRFAMFIGSADFFIAWQAEWLQNLYFCSDFMFLAMLSFIQAYA